MYFWGHREPRAQVEDAAALGVLPAPAEQGLGRRRVHQGLGRGLEAGAQERAGGTERQRGGDTAAVRDPAGGQHRHGRHEIDDDRHEGQGGAARSAAVPAGLRALRHDQVGAQVHGLAGLVEIGDLEDQRRACLPDEVDERARVTERQHHRARGLLERLGDRTEARGPARNPTPQGSPVAATSGSSRASQSRSP